MLEVSNLDEVAASEELLESSKTILLVVIDVDDLENFQSCGSVDFVMVVEVEDVRKESFGLHVFEHSALILVMLVENYFNIAHTSYDSLLSLLCEANHVLIEHICQ